MSTEIIKPWYRQFWFWYLMTPLFVVVIVVSILISVAYENADDVVIDNYYKEGRMINQVVVQHRRAAELNLSGALAFDRTTGDVTLDMPQGSELPDTLLLLLDHPFEADLDQTVTLQRLVENRYAGQLEKTVDHMWYLTLIPELDKNLRKNADWVLSGQIRFAEGDSILLQPLAH
jgi:hypothetical protein